MYSYLQDKQMIRKLKKSNSIRSSKLLLLILIASGFIPTRAMEEKTINEQLWEAVQNNDSPKAKELLLMGGNPNFLPSPKDRSMIEIALEKGSIDLATALLERGASWEEVIQLVKDEYTFEQDPTLLWAIEHGWNLPTLSTAFYYATIELAQNEFLKKLHGEEKDYASTALLSAANPEFDDDIPEYLQELFPKIDIPSVLQSALKVAALSTLLNFEQITEKYVDNAAWNTAMGEALMIAAAQGNAKGDNDIVDFILEDYGNRIKPSFITMALERALLAKHYGTAGKIWRWARDTRFFLKQKNVETRGADLTRILMFAALHGASRQNVSLNVFYSVLKYIKDKHIEKVDIDAVILFLQVLIRQETLKTEPSKNLQEKLKFAISKLEELKEEHREISLEETLRGAINRITSYLFWSPLGPVAISALMVPLMQQYETSK
jgi:ankyrin repeat protein